MTAVIKRRGAGDLAASSGGAADGLELDDMFFIVWCRDG
jgi:hypothetical protein